MTYEAAEKKAFEETMNNDAVTPDRAVAEYKLALRRYGWEKTEKGPVPYTAPKSGWDSAMGRD